MKNNFQSSVSINHKKITISNPDPKFSSQYFTKKIEISHGSTYFYLFDALIFFFFSHKIEKVYFLTLISIWKITKTKPIKFVRGNKPREKLQNTKQKIWFKNSSQKFNFNQIAEVFIFVPSLKFNELVLSGSMKSSMVMCFF